MGRGVRGSWGKKFQGVEGNIALRGKKKYYWFLHATRLDVSLRSNMYLGETKLVFFSRSTRIFPFQSCLHPPTDSMAYKGFKGVVE